MDRSIFKFKKTDLLDINKVYVTFTAIHTLVVASISLLFLAFGHYQEAAVVGLGVLTYFLCLVLYTKYHLVFISKIISMLTLYGIVAYFYVGLNYGPVSFLSVFVAIIPIYSVLVTRRINHLKLITSSVLYGLTLYFIWAFNNYGLNWNALVTDYQAILAALFSIILGNNLAVHLTLFLDLVDNQKLEVENARNKLGAFISAISHQLKTPLNGIMGIQNLLENNELEENENELYEILKHSSISMMRDMNNIMEVGKLESEMVTLHKEYFSIDELIEDISYIYKENLFNKKQNINYTPNHQIYLGDKSKIRLILENVFDTIVNFNGNSLIDLSVEETDKGTQISIIDRTGNKSKNQQMLHLDFRNLAINEFRETNALGLYIASTLADFLQGEFQLLPSDEKDIEYRLSLPMTSIKDRMVDEWEHTPHKKIERILLVEDNAISRKIISSHFSNKNYQITTSVNGLDALEYVKNNYDNIDVIFMDIQMPVMDGITATKKIRNWEFNNSNGMKPIIALTANTMFEDKLLCYSSGMNYFMGKPFNPQKMELLLKKIESNKNF